ncbi:MAG TPA: hypothetical protein VKE94_16600 [Gemmataceae bacterium]|nr:hypothetical protein [Gemmataceae bacterium]
MSDHATPEAVGQLHFPASEWEELMKEDRHGGTMVIGLMASIFSIGLLLYLGVFISVI